MDETPFATADDVASRWRALTPAEEAIADQLCIDVSQMIRERWPDVDARVSAETLSLLTLTRITAGAVKRAMLNADAEGVASRSEAVGPFSHSDTFANPNANLYFTGEDIRTLDGRRARKAFAVDLSQPYRCDY